MGEVSQGLHLPHIVLHGDEQFQSLGSNGNGRVFVMLTLGNGHQQGHAVGHPFLVFDGLANPEGVLSSGSRFVELTLCKVEKGNVMVDGSGEGRCSFHAFGILCEAEVALKAGINHFQGFKTGPTLLLIRLGHGAGVLE